MDQGHYPHPRRRAQAIYPRQPHFDAGTSHFGERSIPNSQHPFSFQPFVGQWHNPAAYPGPPGPPAHHPHTSHYHHSGIGIGHPHFSENQASHHFSSFPLQGGASYQHRHPGFAQYHQQQGYWHNPAGQGISNDHGTIHSSHQLGVHAPRPLRPTNIHHIVSNRDLFTPEQLRIPSTSDQLCLAPAISRLDPCAATFEMPSSWTPEASVSQDTERSIFQGQSDTPVSDSSLIGALTPKTNETLQDAIANNVGQAQAPPRKYQAIMPPGRRNLTAACTHPTMVRIYSNDLRCDSCHEPGAFGWLYRCSSDREELIRQMAHVKSKKATFDDIGEKFVAEMKPAERGPEARADKYSFFKEITNEQLKTYTPAQIETILKQRENVQNVIEEELAKRRDARAEQAEKVKAMSEQTGAQDCMVDTSKQERWDELEKTRPWVPRPETECQFKACPACRQSGADRAYLSIDAVLKGDYSATAATGFGFHTFGQRPVADADVVAKLGQAGEQSASKPLQDMTVDELLAQGIPGDFYKDLAAAGLLNRRSTTSAAASADNFAKTGAQQLGENASFANKGNLPRSPGSPDLAYLTGKKRRGDFVDSQGQPAAQLYQHVPTTGEAVPSEKKTDMEEKELQEGEFGGKPLKVDKGVAVLEESVELHVPDVITQL